MDIVDATISVVVSLKVEIDSDKTVVVIIEPDVPLVATVAVAVSFERLDVLPSGTPVEVTPADCVTVAVKLVAVPSPLLRVALGAEVVPLDKAVVTTTVAVPRVEVAPESLVSLAVNPPPEVTDGVASVTVVVVVVARPVAEEESVMTELFA